MGIDYTPSFVNYTGQGKFRFWCQSVLPLVYDDSLSYMELLNKMVIYLNNTIQDVAAVETNVDALLNAYNQLQTYVNDYFDNLDVQDEINIKLDGLVEDGTMDKLLEPFVTAQVPGLVETGLPGVVENQIDDVVANQIDDVVGEQIGDVVAEQIPNQVTRWLNDNVTPVGSAVAVDSSLSIKGAAADAKVTGNKLSDLKNATESIYAVVAYKIEINALNKVVPFFVNAGDVITVTAKNGGAITVGEIHLLRADGTDDYWLINNYESRSINIRESFVSAFLSNGTAQSIVIENTGSYLNFQPQIDEIKNEADENASTLTAVKAMVGINEPTYAVTDGKYISPSGNITDGSAFQYSAPIPVVAGQKVSLYAKGYSTNIAMISTVNSSGGDIAPKVISTETALLTYEYTVKTDGYIAISYAKSTEHKLTIYTYRIDNLENSISDLASIESITPSVNEGFIHRDGRIMEGSNFRYSNPIRLENETISFKARGYSNSVSLICTCDQNGGNRINIVNSTNSDVLDLSYKSNGVTYIIISSNVSQPINYTTVKNIAPSAIPYVNLSMFEKFGVIGDSYASGALFYNNTEKDDYAHSWGQIMARNHGTTCTNYSKGGLSTRTWLTDNKGLSLMQASDPEDIYYLALGINDYHSLGTDYLGDISDITSHSSYTEYPDTFYGNYGKIIEQIQAHASHCKMIMFTIAGGGTNATKDAYNDAIIEIANHYELPYIVQDDDAFFMSDFYNKTKVEGHPIAITYSGMADAFERLLINCIRNNVAYFRNTFCYD